MWCVLWLVGHATRRRDVFPQAVAIHCLRGLVRWCIVDVALLGELHHAQDDLTLFNASEFDILSDNRVDKDLVRVALLHKLLVQQTTQGLSDLEELVNFKHRRSVNYRGKSLIHVLGRSISMLANK